MADILGKWDSVKFLVVFCASPVRAEHEPLKLTGTFVYIWVLSWVNLQSLRSSVLEGMLAVPVSWNKQIALERNGWIRCVKKKSYVLLNNFVVAN